MSQKVFITGASGWLGSNLVEKLIQRGNKLVCLIERKEYRNVSNWKKYPKDLLEIIVGDILDSTTYSPHLETCDSVIHTAAAQHPKKISDIYLINHSATILLAKEAIKNGIKKFIFISSSSVLGENTEKNRPLNDESPYMGFTHYNFSKIQAERDLLELSQHTSMTLVCVRPGVFYSSQPSINLQNLLSMLKTSRVPLFGPEGSYRSYVDLNQVIELCCKLLDHSSSTYFSYLIGDKTPLTTLEFYETLASGLAQAQPSKYLRLPLVASRIAEKIAYYGGKASGMHIKTANIAGEFGRNHFFDSTRANQLGMELLEDSRPGLKKMAQVYGEICRTHSDQERVLLDLQVPL